jgi:hypothetical protein
VELGLQWSERDHAGDGAHASTTIIPAVPSSLALGGTYLIFSEIGYFFTPPAAGAMGFMPNGINLEDVAYTRPRQSACVIYSTPTSGALPACPQ